MGTAARERGGEEQEHVVGQYEGVLFKWRGHSQDVHKADRRQRQMHLGDSSQQAEESTSHERLVAEDEHGVEQDEHALTNTNSK